MTNLAMILILSLILPVSAYSADTITWLALKLPPVWISSGEMKGKGIVDTQKKVIMRYLPELKHKDMVVNPKRLRKQMQKKDETYCIAAVPKNIAYKGMLHYSRPVNSTVPIAIITTKEKAKYIGADGSKVSLVKLMEKRDLTLAVTNGRFYSKKINEIIHKRRAQHNIVHTNSGMTNPIGMLFKGRVDYTVDYPPSAFYHSKLAGREQDLVSILIEEGADCFNYYVACNMTPLGKRVVKKVNTMITEIQSNDDFLLGTSNWFPDSLLPHLKSCREKAGLTPNKLDLK